MPPTRGLSRRALLLSAGGFAVAVTAGCNPFSTTRQTVTVTQEAPPPVDPMVNLIASTLLHVLRLNTAITAIPDKAAALTGLRDDRAAHLDALRQEYRRASPGSPAAGSSAPITGTVAMSSDAQQVMADLRQDAARGQVQMIDAMGNAPRYRATLFGSIAACLATHRAVLA